MYPQSYEDEIADVKREIHELQKGIKTNEEALQYLYRVRDFTEAWPYSVQQMFRIQETHMRIWNLEVELGRMEKQLFSLKKKMEMLEQPSFAGRAFEIP
ncbi:hypothetical protein BDV96DRAFT_691945 [Lophiotrema nucula]|uniref:Uncharacterized protein n=1 Tax=Lophiotrema nucula TaxID=690887 RepID=A0A6A5YR75_9PLEO|nr:hypothetical protein BDV96DRAFT_691945 [Lophiotrema nucula]